MGRFSGGLSIARERVMYNNKRVTSKIVKPSLSTWNLPAERRLVVVNYCISLLLRTTCAISYPEQLATLFDFADGRVTIERHQNHNKASKGTGFEFDYVR